jgi:hypothetical protein
VHTCQRRGCPGVGSRSGGCARVRLGEPFPQVALQDPPVHPKPGEGEGGKKKKREKRKTSGQGAKTPSPHYNRESCSVEKGLPVISVSLSKHGVRIPRVATWGKCDHRSDPNTCGPEHTRETPASDLRSIVKRLRSQRRVDVPRDSTAARSTLPEESASRHRACADPAVDRVLDARGRRRARVLGALVVHAIVKDIVEHQRHVFLRLD